MSSPDKTASTLDAILAEVLEEYLEAAHAGTAPPSPSCLPGTPSWLPNWRPVSRVSISSAEPLPLPLHPQATRLFPAASCRPMY